MTMTFKKATKHQAKLRLALIGPSGAGKTYTSLAIAKNLGSRVALLDTEHGSASKYADLFEFDTLELVSYHPQNYIDAIRAAQEAGYDVLVIDSLSHAWTGKDGVLELVNRRGGRFDAWGEATPLQHALVDAILASKIHVIATLRSKMEYVQEKDEKTGKTTIRKVGLQPVQRDSMEYEFDVIGDINMDNTLVIAKTRCPSIAGKSYARAGADIAAELRQWLSAGAPALNIPDPEQLASLKTRLSTLRNECRLMSGSPLPVSPASQMPTLEELNGWIAAQEAANQELFEQRDREAAEADQAAAEAAIPATSAVASPVDIPEGITSDVGPEPRLAS